MVAAARKNEVLWKPSEFGSIPQDWLIAEAFDFEPYITSGSRGWARYYSDQGRAFIRITNLSHDYIYPDLSDLRHVRIDPSDAEVNRTALQIGDVLISITADIGAIGFVDARVPLPSHINQHIACLRLPADKIDSRYVAYFLTSTMAQRRFSAMLDVGAKTGLNLTAIGKLKLLLPPTLREQRAIAEALSDADALIEGLERLIAKKRAIKQGAMQGLLSGRRRLPGFSGEWVETALDHLVDCDPESLSGSTPHDFEFNYIALEDVNQGMLRCSTRCTFGTAPSRARRRLRYGDVLFGTVRPNLQSHLWFNEAGTDWVASTGFCVLRAKAGVAHPGFVYQCLFAESITRQIEAQIAGSNYPAVSRRDVAGFRVLAPTYDEQRAIAQVIQDLDDELTAIVARHAKALKLKAGMMQELLTGRVRLV